MRAAVLHEVGTALDVTELELDPPGPGDVAVRLAASGVCRSDLSIVDGAIPSPLPVVLGHEGAGVVEEVGDGVRHLVAGDHVVLSWVNPCRACPHCLRGRVELCVHGVDRAYAGPYARLGGTGVHPGFGTATFGERTVVPAGAAVPIDRELPLEHAALIGCGVVTGVGAAVHAARVAPGDTVAVVGCGGVGLAAVQGARLAGAGRIVAVDVVAAKLGEARRHGATDVVDASSVDPVAAVHDLTGGGVDHALEVVGRSGTILQAYGMARRGGSVTIVGAGRFDDLVSIPAMTLMVDAKTVRGCVYGGTDPQRDFPRMAQLALSGRLDLEALVTRRIALDDVNDAFAAMQRAEVARSVIVYP
jgi:S-(hydroxymethyl)glutathione dehydrogenase/alcohol dehydrogenase